MNLPAKCIVDTNVPINANRVKEVANMPADLRDCVLRCVIAIDHVIHNGGFVIDSGDEIYKEYLNNLSFCENDGIGSAFMKWVHDNRWSLPESDRVNISSNGDSYDEFPDHEGLAEFDRSDRKFVAVANAHPEKPPILQSTDSKWWGWKEPLEEVGINVCFLCPEFVKTKFAEKMGE